MADILNRIKNKAVRTLLPYLTFNKESKFKKIGFDYSKFKRVIIFETSFGWEGIMRQRPQQLAYYMDKETLVIYHSSKEKYSNHEKYIRNKENLYIVNLDLYRKILFESLNDISEKFVFVYSTDPIKLNTVKQYEKQGFKVVFEYVDDLNPELCSGKVYGKLIEKYDYLIGNAHAIICTSTLLYENLKDKSKAVLSTNGCDIENFRFRNYEIPEDMKFNSGLPIVGYYGALASWMDYSLLRAIADTGRFEIVLLGISYDGTLEKSGILNCEHVHYLGRKDYGELPSYSCNFDVCIIPFIINDITKATSPVKLFEYMASERPVVTTDMPECRKYKSVLRAESIEEFISKLDEALDLGKGSEYKKLLIQEAENNTWVSKCSEIINFI